MTFKTFTFIDGKSKDVYPDVVEKFDAFCQRGTNKVIKRHQFLSTKQNTINIDEYVTSLQKIARECNRTQSMMISCFKLYSLASTMTN